MAAQGNWRVSLRCLFHNLLFFNGCIMKKRLLSLVALGVAALGLHQVSAQSVLLSENFEGAGFPPSGWVALDADGDGNTWELTANGMFSQSGSSRQIAISFARNYQDYNQVYGAQDNWLITPEFTVKNASVTLEFEYCAQDLEQTEPLEVLVSETGASDVGDFTATLWKTTVDNGYEDDPVVSSKKIGLSDYAGKTVRVAFRHKTSGTYALSIDNVVVNNQMGPQIPKWYEATADAAGSNSVYIKWLNPTKNGNGDDLESVSVNVYRNGEIVHVAEDMTPGSDGEWTDTSVTPGDYSYTLSAFTDEGEGRQISAKNVRVGEDIPAEVAQTCARAVGNSVVLTWERPTKGANSTYSKPTVFNPENVRFIVKRLDGENETILTETLNETIYTDSGLESGKTYRYTVQAKNDAGISAVLDVASAYIAPEGVAELAVAQTRERVNRSDRVPFDTSDEFDVSQTLYFPDELQFARGTVNSVIYKIYGSMDIETVIPVRIYLAESDKQDFNDKQWADMADATKVFEGTVCLVQGSHDYKIDFDVPFEYTGRNLVVTTIKDGKPNAKYSDCFYTIESDRGGRSMVTSTYSKVDIAAMPHSTYSDKATNVVPSVRFLMDLKDTGSLSGKVTDSSTGSPLAGAVVSVTSVEGLTATADAEGNYAIPYLPVGTHAVSVETAGYVTADATIEVTDKEAVVKDFALVRLANYELKGVVKAGDTGLGAAGAVVRLSGYEDVAVTADDQGRWSISGVYSGKDYTLEISYPIYDLYVKDLNNESETTVDEGEIMLERSLIPPFAVNAVVAADGSNVSLSWSDPLARTGVPGDKSIGDVSIVNSDGGDYYVTDYNVAHQFLAEDIEEQDMAGMSVTGLKVYIKADAGTFTAHVWEGDRENHKVLASKEIPAEELVKEGKWMEVKFDEPVEIKAGGSYLVGVNCNGYEGSSTFGTAPYGSRVAGKNDVKFDDAGYTSNGYSAWCIITECAVPASPAGVASNDDAPKCSYNVYRGTQEETTGVTEWEKVTTSPVNETSFTDAGWASLMSGEFVYGVSAVYQNGESIKAFSNGLSHSNDCDVAVTAFVDPQKAVEIRSEINVTVTVTNLGEKPATDIPVTFAMDGGEQVQKILEGTLNKGESANVEFGTFGIDESVHTLVASTALEGDEVASNDAMSFILPNKVNAELTAYRWSAYGNAGFMKVQSNNPEAADFRKEFTTKEGLMISGEYLDGKIYAYTATWYQAPREFIVIDPVTWTVVDETSNDDYFILDMAYDYSTETMFGLEPLSAEEVNLVKINLTDGTPSVIGSLGQIVRAIACDREGNLYGMSGTGSLLKIDPLTAQTTVVGDTGFGSVVYLQSMAFDHNTGRLFWAATSDDVMGEIYEVDPFTAECEHYGSTLFNGVEPSELVCLHTPYTHIHDGVDAAVKDAADTLKASVNARGDAAVTTAEDASVKVFDSLGALVYETSVAAGTTRFTLDLVSGIYMMQISDAVGSELTVKFVIR